LKEEKKRKKKKNPFFPQLENLTKSFFGVIIEGGQYT